jgi:hypothetical protein
VQPCHSSPIKSTLVCFLAACHICPTKSFHWSDPPPWVRGIEAILHLAYQAPLAISLRFPGILVGASVSSRIRGLLDAKLEPWISNDDLVESPLNRWTRSTPGCRLAPEGKFPSEKWPLQKLKPEAGRWTSVSQVRLNPEAWCGSLTPDCRKSHVAQCGCAPKYCISAEQVSTWR